MDFRPESPIADRLLDAVEMRPPGRQGRGPREASEIAPGGHAMAELASGPRRFRYLALAAGSFAMTVVGLIVPGIPTVPFLLATSYYLAARHPG